MNKKKQTLISLIIISLCLILVVFLYFAQEDETPFIHDQKDSTLTTDNQPITSTPSALPSTQQTEPAATPSITIDEEGLSPAIDFTDDQEANTISTEMIITEERQNYRSGALSLIIPKLDFMDGVENGTEEATLDKGPALYEYAQLPGEGDRNVSIAAHRNTSRNGVIGEWYFYYIDTLTTGDYLYLTDGNYIYQYEYDQTTVVDAYDWTPIYRQGFSCLTLTSCEPIGVSTHRIIVRSKLLQILPYTVDFIYESSYHES